MSKTVFPANGQRDHKLWKFHEASSASGMEFQMLPKVGALPEVYVRAFSRASDGSHILNEKNAK